ncbi:type II secretion system F family protein [Pajaroellobacter abortibovis]|uniref:Type II secretion system protein GspF domain-containing protein n=1 Tax=Pajaroellobacter abortibovis TaxID=1882918 RepID=A0A1L6MYC2_9BACT|nr:type II secretion system F family protein [Pajaroellobacter abortibovis]APS00530.1 hypothetical protein BCY86_07465 [Pajaroellobacter abortibovis]
MQSFEYLRFLFLSFLMLAIGTALYGVMSAPSRIASRLGLRGLKRQTALQRGGLWPLMEPIVRWLGVRVSGALGDELHAKLDRQLQIAGDYLGLTPEEYVAITLLSGFLISTGGVLFGLFVGDPLLFFLIAAPLGAVLPYMKITGESQKRLKQISRKLPYVIDLMALSMSAGLDFPGSIRQVIEKSTDIEDTLIEELTHILHELQLGRTRKEALIGFMIRAPIDAVTEFVTALIQAEERGNPVAEVLMIQADSSRLRRSEQAEAAAAKAGVAMMGPLVLVFICIMILMIGPTILQLSNTAN